MATYSALFSLVLFGAFIGTLGGLITGWILRRAMPTRSGISLRWIAIGWAAAWAIGLGIMGALLVGASGRDTIIIAAAFGTTAIGGIGGGVTFRQIEQARRLSPAAAVEATTPAPKAVSLDKSIRQSIVVVCGGWIASWVVGVTWAQISPAVTVVYGSWAGVSMITGFVLRSIAPSIEWKRIALIAIGWPLCLIIGMAAALENNWTLPVGVAACGWLAASALIPSIPGRNWLYGGVAAATWTASWSVGSSYAWGAALAPPSINPNFQLFEVTRIRPDASFVLLILGAIFSGLVGGRMLFRLFDQARHELSTRAASLRSEAMRDKSIAQPIVALGSGWIGLWMLAVLLAKALSWYSDVSIMLVTWIAVSLLTGFVLYRIAPNMHTYPLLIVVGWPLCLMISAASYPQSLWLSLAVAACGLLAAWALTPLMPSISWLQRLGIAGVWAGCWVISSSIWNAALVSINLNQIGLAEFIGLSFTAFVNMTSGAILSGVLSSVVLYWLLDQTRRKSSRFVASPEGNPQ